MRHGRRLRCPRTSRSATTGCRPPEGRRRRLIVSPGRCWLPEGHRAWGWAVQLYATRSRGSWGIGDLADLRAVRRMAADQGAGFVLINPLHAVAPIPEQEASPYLPATRRFRNPLYLRVAEVPGADGVDLEDDAGRALSDGELIDRDAIWARKREVLMRIFLAHGGGEALRRAGARSRAATLQEWATWAALADQHGADWHAWPAELRDPARPAVADLRRAARRRRSPSTPGCSGRWSCSSPRPPTA